MVISVPLLLFFMFGTEEVVVFVISRKIGRRRRNFVFMIGDFDNTKLALRTPLSQGRICGKLKSGRSTVKTFLQLRRITVDGCAGRNTYRKALKYEDAV